MSIRRLVLTLLACVAVGVFVIGFARAEASTRAAFPGLAEAPRVAPSSRGAQVQPRDEALPHGEVRAVEFEDLEQDATLERPIAQGTTSGASLAVFVRSVMGVWREGKARDPFVSHTSARGPPCG